MNDETYDTRSRILEAAVRVFAQKGYHDARVEDIVTESNTSKGSVYFYFPSKQDIFLGLVDTFMRMLESKVNEAVNNDDHGIQQLDGALQTTLKLFSQYRPLAKIVLIQAAGLGSAFESHRRSVNDRITTIIKKRLQQAIKDDSIPDLNTDIASRIWVGALNEIVIDWIFNGTDDIQETIPTIRRMLLRSIGVPDERI